MQHCLSGYQEHFNLLILQQEEEMPHYLQKNWFLLVLMHSGKSFATNYFTVYEDQTLPESVAGITVETHSECKFLYSMQIQH